MGEVFEAVDPAVTDEMFLEVFQSSCCYLVDLCREPVDDMPRALRRAACRAGEQMTGQNDRPAASVKDCEDALLDR